MMMVLFFRGDLTLSFEDSLSWRMATSATGSEPFSTRSSAGGKAALSTVHARHLGTNGPQAEVGNYLLEGARAELV